MLILGRTKGQGIFITTPSGDRIYVCNLGDGKIGIEAHKDVKILREELVERKEQKNGA